MTLSLPPFTRAVTWLIGINTGVYLLMVIFGRSSFVAYVGSYGELVPSDVVHHGFIWQLVTYSFIHDTHGISHWLWNMIGLWMFGSAVENAWGTRRFLELYFIGLIGAAITTIALAFAHILGNPETATVGASGGIYAILIAFGILFAENEIMMIPFPIAIKAKYFVGILIVVTLVLAISGGGNVAYVAHLGGLLFGWLYVRRGPKPALVNVGLSERYYGFRNSYYRWKRRRAARKFEVYMRKTENRQVHFDEHGNYVPPEDETRKGNGGGKSGWVN
jgi:membrane associated rhomboid family serine protease